MFTKVVSSPPPTPYHMFFILSPKVTLGEKLGDHIKSFIPVMYYNEVLLGEGVGEHIFRKYIPFSIHMFFGSVLKYYNGVFLLAGWVSKISEVKTHALVIIALPPSHRQSLFE